MTSSQRSLYTLHMRKTIPEIWDCSHRKQTVCLQQISRSTVREKKEGETAMLGEENKALVRLFIEEFWNKGNMAAADELLAADATIVLPGRGQVNLKDFKAF